MDVTHIKQIFSILISCRSKGTWQ